MHLKHANKKIVFALIFPLIVFPFFANAENEIREEFKSGQGITMSPVTFELTADPGDILTNVIKISNPTDSAVGVKMEVEDFTAAGDTGKVEVMEEENGAYSLKKWIKTDPENFVLESGSARIVNFKITVPANAEPGGHYASVLSVISADAKNPGGSAISQKVGALVLLSISGEVKESLTIKEFSAPKISEKGPINFTISLENTGSIHVKPRGFISISNMSGKKIIDIPFPQKNILPGAIRKLEAQWEEEFLFGKYQADLVGAYGTNNDNKALEATIEFWVIPWKTLLVASGIFLFLMFIAYKLRRRLLLALKALIKG